MGWQFTVTVPSWTQTELHNRELVVFYRVEVNVQQTFGADQVFGKPRSVLRRFSHFIKLYDKLKEELGQTALTGKDPPNRRSLLSINKRPDLIEARRKELEQWLWRLVNDPAIARSRTLNKFLELSVAAKVVERSAATQRAVLRQSVSEEGDSSQILAGPTQYAAQMDMALRANSEAGPSGSVTVPHGSYSEEDGTVSQWGDTASVMTETFSEVRTASSRARHKSLAPSLASGHVDPGHMPHRLVSSSGSGLTGPASGSGLAAETKMRLGLRVEQRSSIRKQVLMLKDRLDAASNDLAAAVHALATEEQRGTELALRVQDLEAKLAAGVSEREAELELQVAHQRERAATLAHELEEQSLAMDLLRQQLEFAPPRATVNSAGELTSAVDHMLLNGDGQHQVMQGGPHPTAAHMQSNAIAAHGPPVSAGNHVVEKGNSAHLVTELQAQVERLNQELQEGSAAKVALEDKYRNDLKVLAKEVKSLRKQLAMSGQQQGPA